MDHLEALKQNIDSLRKDLHSKIITSPEEGHSVPPNPNRITTCPGACSDITWEKLTRDGTDNDEGGWVVDREEITRPNYALRRSANKKLKIIYKNTQSDEIKKLSGKALRYSNLRMWSHEHPVLATVGALGSSLAVAYTLFEYFNN